MNKMRQWSMLTAVAVAVVFVAGWFLACRRSDTTPPTFARRR